MGMDFTLEMAKDFQGWILGGKLNDSSYAVHFASANSCMIYGANSPQVLLLTLELLTNKAIETHQVPLLGWMPAVDLKGMVDDIRANPDKNKTLFEQVSNFWLKSSKSFTEQSISVDNYKLPSHPTSKDYREQGKRDRKLQGVLSEPGTGEFLSRMKTAGFGIGDLTGKDTSHFTGPRAKGRNMTTHNNTMTVNDLIYDYTVRRACKFLLYDSIKDKKKIVYLLDDLDIGKIAYMVDPQDGKIPDYARVGDQKKVPVCTSEVREIFRYWDYLQNHVTFFKNLLRCDAPWADPTYQEKWAAYAKHRAAKALSGDKVSGGDKLKLQECVAAFGLSNWGKAIQCYHESNPSKYFSKGFDYATTNQLETLAI
jgi:hypothetical protein